VRAHEIEAWTLDVIEQVRSGQPHEDYRVELKTQWPNAQKAARQIAGHANAAHGEPILWIIGLDEKSGVVGASNEELANWSSQYAAEFDGPSPQLLRDLNVRAGEMTVVALLFDTDRAPYLVRNPAFGQTCGGPVQLEVPWREGRSTKTASRSDLLRLLSPLQKNPSFELLGASLKVYPELKRNEVGELACSDDPKRFTWKLRMDFYISPRTDARVVIPFHRCTASFDVPQCVSETALEVFVMEPPRSITYRGNALAMGFDSATIQSTKYEMLIDGPGRVMLRGEVEIPKGELSCERAEVKISVRPVDSEHAISFRETLHQTPPDGSQHELACWTLDRERRGEHDDS